MMYYNLPDKYFYPVVEKDDLEFEENLFRSIDVEASEEEEKREVMDSTEGNEVVEDKVNGIFIKVKDSDSIYEKITYIQNNRNLIENLSIKAKETIFQKFSPIKYIENLNSIYKQLK